MNLSVQSAARDTLALHVATHADADADADVDATLTEVGHVDWDTLFTAVKQRLRLIVDTHAGTLFELRLPDDARRVDTGVLECVAALDQLHAMLIEERTRIMPP